MKALCCPVCRGALRREEKRFICDLGHGFDLARQGYVNLLLSSQRPSKSPGDSAAMLADRRAFLDAGYYQPLREHLVERVGQVLQRAPTQPHQVLDLGCGEGYYSAALAAPGRDVYALDIAKPALAIGAKRSAEVVWCVGNSRALPFFDTSLDVVLNIFCCPHPAETRRVLRDEGVLLMVGPGPAHLEEMRRILYDTVRVQESTNLARVQEQGLALRHSETLSYTVHIAGPAIGQLARMTPHYWRASAPGRERLDTTEQLTVRAEFIVQEFTR